MGLWPLLLFALSPEGLCEGLLDDSNQGHLSSKVSGPMFSSLFIPGKMKWIKALDVSQLQAVQIG